MSKIIVHHKCSENIGEFKVVPFGEVSLNEAKAVLEVVYDDAGDIYCDLDIEIQYCPWCGVALRAGVS